MAETHSTLADRFWAKVEKTDGCWEWMGAQTSHGRYGRYGKILFNGRHVKAHRVAWTLTFGAIPDTLCVHHSCGNLLCVRPDHLFIGRHGDAHSFETRFWRRVNKTESCWLWTGGHLLRGYGVTRRDGKAVSAHRASWELHNGPIPAGLCVLHRCDVPACVRPDHLFLGTNQDNSTDAIVKGRQAHGETSGHAKLTRAIVADVLAIKSFKRGEALALASRLGVSLSTIMQIRSRKTWK